MKKSILTILCVLSIFAMPIFGAEIDYSKYDILVENGKSNFVILDEYYVANLQTEEIQKLLELGEKTYIEKNGIKIYTPETSFLIKSCKGELSKRTDGSKTRSNGECLVMTKESQLALIEEALSTNWIPGTTVVMIDNQDGVVAFK